jgi:hypothetical protein
MSDAIRAAVAAKLEFLNITFTASHAGADIGKAYEWECDKWRIVFQKQYDPSAKGNYATLATDYRTGLGHRKVPKHQESFMARELKEHHSSWRAEITARYAKPVAPDAASVLHSLCMDSQAGQESFSNWCDNSGCSSDSISALNTYQACEKIAREMQAFFGVDVCRELAEIVQDY